jgi:hypothetical protein
MRRKPERLVNFINAKAFCFAMVLLAIASCTSFGQSITWQRTYDSQFHGNDLAEDLLDAGNGFYYAVGTTQRLNSYSSIFLLKINQKGDTIWTRYIDTAYGRAITKSADGGIICTGIKYEAFAIKVDTSGNVIWNRKYTQNIIFTGLDLITTNDSNYVICGSAYYDSAYVCMLDKNGSMLWNKIYSSGYRKRFLSIYEEVGEGFLLVGYQNNNSNDTTRGLLTKIDYDGNIVWEKTLVNRGNTVYKGIQKTNNEYIVNGEVFDGSNFRHFFLKTDLNGNILYLKSFENTIDEFNSKLALTTDNRFIFSTSSLTETFPFRYYTKLMLTDNFGNILLQKYYHAPKDLNIYSITPLSNGDVLFTGLAEFDTYSDVYVLRTDSSFMAPPPIGIIKNQLEIPNTFALSNYPNPFNASTNITFSLNITSKVKIEIADLNGKILEKIIEANLIPSLYNLQWSANNYASGVYFVLLYTNDILAESRKMILIK